MIPEDHLCSSLVFQNHSLPTASKISGANQLLIRVSSFLFLFPDVLGRMTVNQSLLWKCLMSKRMLSAVNFPLAFSATNSDVTSGTTLSSCSRMADVSACYLLKFSWTHFFFPFSQTDLLSPLVRQTCLLCFLNINVLYNYRFRDLAVVIVLTPREFLYRFALEYLKAVRKVLILLFQSK